MLVQYVHCIKNKYNWEANQIRRLGIFGEIQSKKVLNPLMVVV